MRSIKNLSAAEILQRFSAPIILLVLIVFNALFTRNFLSINVLWNAIMQSSSIMFVSLGMMVVIASGGIDISVGSTLGFGSALLVITSYAGGDTNSLLAVIVPVIGCALVGIIQGLIIAKFKIPPLIVTLAFQSLIRGIAQYCTKGKVLVLRDPLLNELGYLKVGGTSIPIQLVFIAIAIVIFYILTKKMAFGSRIEAYGDNPVASRIVGIRTFQLVTLVYMISGIACACGSILETTRIQAADSSMLGLNMEMDAIAAVAISGTPLTGGKIRIWGTIVGVFITQLITMTVNMNNIQYEYSLLLKGAIIFFAILVQKSKEKTKKGLRQVVQNG